MSNTTGPSGNTNLTDTRTDPAMKALYHMSRTAGVGLGDYAAINVLAVVGLIVGIACFLLLIFGDSLIMLVLPAAALIVCVVAILQIRNSNGTQVGTGLAAAGIALGLVSNAQFYTVPVLEKALGAILDDLSIDPALCQFSYRVKRAKPDLCLFHAVRDTLASRGVPATEVLYVGNDVQKDIDPARASGFRTALLAGDQQSLRLHGRTLEGTGADWIVNDLREIVEVVTSGVPR